VIKPFEYKEPTVLNSKRKTEIMTKPSLKNIYKRSEQVGQKRVTKRKNKYANVQSKYKDTYLWVLKKRMENENKS
jgi:hypothetical protein